MSDTIQKATDCLAFCKKSMHVAEVSCTYLTQAAGKLNISCMIHSCCADIQPERQPACECGSEIKTSLALAYSCQHTEILQTYGARKVLAPESYVLAAKAPTNTANSTRRGTSTKDSLPSHCTATKQAVVELSACSIILFVGCMSRGFSHRTVAFTQRPYATACMHIKP